jgi:transposase-like protein
MREIEATSYVAIGRKYGVSDNAIRKWVHQYEREAAAGAGDGRLEPRARPP